MRLLIKICGLKQTQHVQVAIESGADAIGLVFADSVRKVTADHAASICSDVPRHIRRVAVMQHPNNRVWKNVLETFKPDVLQTDVDDYATLDVPDTVERWPVYREGQPVPEVNGCFLYEGAKSGHGETVDWSLAAEIAKKHQMILAGGLNANNIAKAISTVRPYGVDVSSAVESAPGQKDSKLIIDFIEAARAAEQGP